MSGPNIGASVRQRLLNQSRALNRPFQELLQYFAMERFLYRLSKSAHVDRFVLKGALLITAWRGPLSRPISLQAETAIKNDALLPSVLARGWRASRRKPVRLIRRSRAL